MEETTPPPPPPSQDPATPPTAAPPAGAGAQPPAAYGGGPPAVVYPIAYEADYPEDGIARWRPFVHWLMAIPHFIVLLFLIIGVYLAYIVAWFAILFTRRYPRGIFEFVAGTGRWIQRVNAFTYLMTDRYPAFSLADDPAYPIRVRFDYPEGGIARWRALVQWLMAIPHFIVLYILGIGVNIVHFIAWFAVLFTRRYPRGMFNFSAGFYRWQTRATGYYLLMTEEYPPFSFD